MTWNRDEGWRSFEREALARIRLGTDVLSWPGQRLVQVVVMAAFGNPECWEVFADWQDSESQPQRHVVVRRVWRVDLRRRLRSRSRQPAL